MTQYYVNSLNSTNNQSLNKNPSNNHFSLSCPFVNDLPKLSNSHKTMEFYSTFKLLTFADNLHSPSISYIRNNWFLNLSSIPIAKKCPNLIQLRENFFLPLNNFKKIN